MKKIVLEPGVVLVEICGEYLLVASREARGKVPYVQHINEAAACYWKMLEENKSPGEIAKAASQRYHMEPQKAVMAVQMFLRQMNERHYLQIVEGTES